MLEIIILLLSVTVNSILGLAVIIKNQRKDVNRLFFYLTLSLSAWAIITFFSLHPFLFSQIIWVRLVLAAAAILCYFVLTSFAVFPDGSFRQLRFVKPATYYLFFVIALTQTPFVFKSLDYGAAGNAQPVASPGIVFFAFLALGFLGGAVFALLRKYRLAKGRIRDQLRVVIFGVATSFAAILATNFVLVSLFKNTSLISFAPLLTLILTGAMAYAILKHRLFDLRLAIARAVAYVMTLGIVVLIYSGLAFLVGQVFSFDNHGLKPAQNLFYVGLAVLTALAFQPLKKFFDKATARFFFKDAYEPQILLDNLSNTLVGNIRLEPLLAQASTLIADSMRLVRCDFLIRFNDKKVGMLSDAFDHKLQSDELFTLLGHRSEQVIITDELPYGRNQEFKDLLQDLDCAAAIRLSTHNAKVGYMIIGNKRSGDSLSTTDMRVLGIMADELAIAIENALRFEEISQFNVTLQQKIEIATRELRKANERLKALDATKDEFISMASHQLRTPLTTIKGYLSMVLEGDAGKVDKQQRQMLQQAFDSSQRMVYLIADLLNVSRLQTGKFVIENKPTNLPEVIKGEISQLKEQIATRHIDLTFEPPEEFPMLNLDENKIRQVIMNFLDNALYYTPAGGQVTARLAVNGDSAEFTVNDSGVGVPKAVQPHLFTKFYRADNARKMRPDGTGLGLYMAKKVITAQGGAIVFHSTEGKGSTFGFSFPLATTEVKQSAKPLAGSRA